MSQYKRVEDLPEYLQAYTDHQIALRDAGEDETGKLRAQLAWSDKTREMEKRMESENKASVAYDQAKARIKEQYPDVPEEIYNTITDQAQMEFAAKSFDEAVKAKSQPQGETSQTTSAPSGQPPTGVDGGSAPQADWVSRKNELAEALNAGKPTRNQITEYMNIKMNKQMLPATLRAKAEARGPQQ